MPQIEIEGVAGIGGLNGVPGQETEAVLIYIVGFCELGEGEDGGNETLGFAARECLAADRIRKEPPENGHGVDGNVRQRTVDNIQRFLPDFFGTVAGYKALIFDSAVPSHNQVLLAGPERGGKSRHTHKTTLYIR